jgi:hypothetical protein
MQKILSVRAVKQQPNAVIFAGSGSTRAIDKLIGICIRIPADLDPEMGFVKEHSTR